MTNFVYISPAFSSHQRELLRAPRRLGRVRVLGVGDLPYEQLPERLRSALAEYYRVDFEDYGRAFARWRSCRSATARSTGSSRTTSTGWPTPACGTTSTCAPGTARRSSSRLARKSAT